MKKLLVNTFKSFPVPAPPIITIIIIMILSPPPQFSSAQNSNLFREYIGAEFKDVKFSDVPINPKVQFDFILSFGIDYTNTSNPVSTNGEFNIFWDTTNLSPSDVLNIKHRHPNVRVALSIGGDSVGPQLAYFEPKSIESWLSNAEASLTQIIREYHLDGVDIDYEHFKTNPETFAKCIGRLVIRLKKNNVIKFASIAPFDDDEVQKHYMALWKGYGHWIDYVNFQFYAYDESTTVDEFIKYYKTQRVNYRGGKVLVSFISDGSGGLAPGHGFFHGCSKLKQMGELFGIFVWSADDSKKLGFRDEIKSQTLLSSDWQ